MPKRCISIENTRPIWTPNAHKKAERVHWNLVLDAPVAPKSDGNTHQVDISVHLETDADFRPADVGFRLQTDAEFRQLDVGGPIANGCRHPRGQCVGVRFEADADYHFFPNVELGAWFKLNADFHNLKNLKVGVWLNWALTSKFFGRRIPQSWRLSSGIFPTVRRTVEVVVQVIFHRQSLSLQFCYSSNKFSFLFWSPLFLSWSNSNSMARAGK